MGWRSRLAPPLLAASLFAAVAAQGAPELGLPVDCEFGGSCAVQSYVAQGDPASDYRCGYLTYPGHQGTDLRVIDVAAWKRGVDVLAAAPGRVRAVRDGMRDIGVRRAGKAAIAGREAGNSVVIEHGEGWETQYAHLRRGSVAVRPGERVERGAKIGLVGLSGNSEFPHLHFEVRRHGRSVDPFLGEAGAEACALGRRPLWSGSALEALVYVPTGVLDAGFSATRPAVADGIVATERVRNAGSKLAAVVFWVQIYGAQENDVEEMRLVAPDGSVIAVRRARIPGNKAQWLAYVGKRRAASSTTWVGGVYRGEYALWRGPGQEKVLSIVRELRLQK